MKQYRIIILAVCVFMLLSGCVIADPNAGRAPIEPDAANWDTWVLASNDELRPAAPPDAAATAAELAELQQMIAAMGEEAHASVLYWDAGAPNYRWIETMMEQYAGGRPSTAVGRSFSILNVAIYDAVIASWDAKHAYNRSRPAGVHALIDVPASPSYPSEHAAAAGAASVVLSHLFPEQAEAFAARADEAAMSRVLAGVHYPSDVEAGLALGRAVGEQVIARSQNDGFASEWTGEIPTGPGIWQGDKPMTPLAGTWQAWTLTDNSQFRAPEPPAYDSEEIQVQIETIKAVEITPTKTRTILFRGSIDGSYFDWLNSANKHIGERHWDHNPPRAALVYSTMSVASFDSIIACFDTKYAYWYIRPSQLDPTVQPRSGVPPHPSYPAAATCNARASAEVLSGFFPEASETLSAAADSAKNARVWAGIHYPMDVEAGSDIGASVAGVAMERANEMTGQ